MFSYAIHSSSPAESPACGNYEAYLDYFITHTLRRQNQKLYRRRPHRRLSPFTPTHHVVSSRLVPHCGPPSRVRDWCRSQDALPSLGVSDTPSSEPPDGGALTPTRTTTTGQSSGGRLEDEEDEEIEKEQHSAHPAEAVVTVCTNAHVTDRTGIILAAQAANTAVISAGVVPVMRTLSSISDEMNYMATVSLTADCLSAAPSHRRVPTSLTAGSDVTSTTMGTTMDEAAREEEEEFCEEEGGAMSAARGEELPPDRAHAAATNSGVVRKPQKSARPTRKKDSALFKSSAKEKVLLLRKVVSGSDIHVIRVVADTSVGASTATLPPRRVLRLLQQ